MTVGPCAIASLNAAKKTAKRVSWMLKAAEWAKDSLALTRSFWQVQARKHKTWNWTIDGYTQEKNDRVGDRP